MMQAGSKAAQRGFTLLVAVVLTSVMLSIALALLDVSFKEVVLASTARQSAAAFYAADTGLECALYYDQQLSAFDFYTAPASQTLVCAGQNITANSSIVETNKRLTTFTMPCVNGTQSSVTVYKTAGATTCNATNGTSCFFSNGYSSCNASDPRRVERGLKVQF
jgi:Tfp pilus assembly protein PilX